MWCRFAEWHAEGVHVGSHVHPESGGVFGQGQRRERRVPRNRKQGEECGRRASSKAVGYEPPHRLLGASPSSPPDVITSKDLLLLCFKRPCTRRYLDSPYLKKEKKTFHQEPRDSKGYTLIEMHTDLTAVPHASLSENLRKPGQIKYGFQTTQSLHGLQLQIDKSKVTMHICR